MSTPDSSATPSTVTASTVTADTASTSTTTTSTTTTSTPASTSTSTSTECATNTSTTPVAPAAAEAAATEQKDSVSAGGVSMPTELLPVIDPPKALEQCGDWLFVAELLEDMMKEQPQIIGGLKEALAENNHTKFHKTAHALKGAALNLHLPALVDVSKKSEMLGKLLEQTPTDSALLAHRDVCIARMDSEYARLAAYIPEARQLAEEEGGEGF